MEDTRDSPNFNYFFLSQNKLLGPFFPPKRTVTDLVYLQKARTDTARMSRGQLNVYTGA